MSHTPISGTAEGDQKGIRSGWSQLGQQRMEVHGVALLSFFSCIYNT